MSQVKEASIFRFSDIRSHSLNGQLNVFKEVVEKLEGFVIAVPVLPRRVLKIRSTRRRLLRLEEGKIARLEYAFIYSVLVSDKPVINNTAILAGDLKATIGYLAFLAENGIIAFQEPDTLSLLAQAHLSLSRKRYERIAQRVKNRSYTLVEEKISQLPEEKIPCIYYENQLLCRYYSTVAPRSQLKAYIKAINSLLSAGKEKQK